MTDYYILEGTTPRPVSFDEYVAWCHTSGHRPTTQICREQITPDTFVSTVFLGIDHSFGHGAPVLYETMVFGGTDETNEYQTRYHTFEEARAGHAATVAWVRWELAVHHD